MTPSIYLPLVASSCVLALMAFRRFNLSTVEFVVACSVLAIALAAITAAEREGFDSVAAIINDVIIPPFDDLIRSYYKTSATDDRVVKEVAIDATRYSAADLATIAVPYKRIGLLFCKLQAADPDKAQRLLALFGAPPVEYDEAPQ
jgi:hypothetical protein